VKILCVLFPHFPLWCEAQNSPSVKSGPAVIMYVFGSQKLVLDASPEFEGIKRDMTLQQALAVNGQVALIQADVPRYWSIFNGLPAILEEKSPLVEGTELGCAYMDWTVSNPSTEAMIFLQSASGKPFRRLSQSAWESPEANSRPTSRQ